MVRWLALALGLCVLSGCHASGAPFASNAGAGTSPPPVPKITEGAPECDPHPTHDQLVAQAGQERLRSCFVRYFRNNQGGASDFILTLRAAEPEKAASADAAFNAIAAAQLQPRRFVDEYVAVAEMYAAQGRWQRVLDVTNYLPEDKQAPTRKARLAGEAMLHLGKVKQGVALLRAVAKADPVAIDAVQLVVVNLPGREAQAYCTELLNKDRDLQANACVSSLGAEDSALPETKLRLLLREGKKTSGSSGAGTFKALANRCDSGAPLPIRWYSTEAVRALFGSEVLSPATFLDAASEKRGLVKSCYLSLAAAACIARLSSEGAGCTPTNAISQYIDSLDKATLVAFVRGVFSARRSFYHTVPASDELLLLHFSLAQAFVKLGPTDMIFTHPEFHLQKAEELWTSLRRTPFPARLRDQLFVTVPVVLPGEECSFTGSVTANGELQQFIGEQGLDIKLPVGSHPVKVAGAVECPKHTCRVFQTRNVDVSQGVTGAFSGTEQKECEVSFVTP